jgi:hypothetical protein
MPRKATRGASFIHGTLLSKLFALIIKDSSSSLVQFWNIVVTEMRVTRRNYEEDVGTPR